MLVHLKTKIAPIRRSMGNKFAPGSYLEETRKSLDDKVWLETKWETQKEPEFDIVEHSKTIADGLNTDDNFQLVGSGNFGKVFKCKDRQTNDNVVVKVISAPYLTEARHKKWIRDVRLEMYLLRKCAHENIVKVYDYIWIKHPKTGQKLHIALKMEHLQISLASLMKDYQIVLNEPQMAHMARQVGSVLNWLHDNRVVHHDIKPANIMIAKIDLTAGPQEINRQLLECPYKFVDFGFARLYNQYRGNCIEKKHANGSLIYVSEQKRATPPNYDPYQADCFAFGTTLVRVLMKEKKFLDSYKLKGTVKAMAESFFKELESAETPFNPNYRNVILRLVAAKDHERIQMDKALEYFK